jgi:predicted house-cleaning noncanonical NTP pyrophosphatase (MazG superfamily)
MDSACDIIVMSRQQLLYHEAIMREYERWLKLLDQLREELATGYIELLHDTERRG